MDSLIGVVSPHAGLSCSGPFAALAFESLRRNVGNNDTIIVLGPNHTGMGAPLSIFPTPGNWETPLGEIQLDDPVARRLLEIGQNSEEELDLAFDSHAHVQEHSIDNQLVFLKAILPEVRVVPICMMDQRPKICRMLGKILATIIKEIKNTYIIASSDMTHYVPHKQAEEQDRQVLKVLTEMNLEEAIRIKNALDVSACGFGPILTLFTAAKESGKKKGILLGYGTSGMTCGSKDAVVGYASMAV